MEPIILTVALTLMGLLTAPGGEDPEVDEPDDGASLSEAFADRWNLNAELNYSDQSGTTSLQLFSAGLNLAHQRRDEFRFDASVRSRYGRSEGDVVSRNHRGDLSVDLQPEEVWSPFIFTEFERDAVRRLRLRMSSGGGAKYTAARAPDGQELASVSLALLHSYERTQEEAEVEDGRDDPLFISTAAHRARWSLRLRGQYDVRAGTRLHFRSYYQPLLDELADYLLRTEAGIRLDLTERLGVSVVYQWDRDTSPSAIAEPDDRLFRTGLVLSL